MGKQIKHSFAIMAYKDAPYLEDTIESVLNQTGTSDVYLSTSTPNERIRTLAERYNLSLFINQKPTGIAGDWNFALSCAKTSYVTLADQDDIYMPTYAAAVTKMLDSSEDSVIAFTKYNEIGSDGLDRKINKTMVIKNILFWPYCFKASISNRMFKKTLLFGDPICSPSVTYNKRNLGQDNLFDASYSVALDWDAWIRLSEKQGRFVYNKKKLIKHRIHTMTQTSQGLSSGKRYKEDLLIFERLWPKAIARLLTKFYSGSYDTNQ